MKNGIQKLESTLCLANKKFGSTEFKPFAIIYSPTFNNFKPSVNIRFHLAQSPRLWFIGLYILCIIIVILIVIVGYGGVAVWRNRATSSMNGPDVHVLLLRLAWVLIDVVGVKGVYRRLMRVLVH